jgi:YidC/Oxa1 family membrane protein insertase
VPGSRISSSGYRHSVAADSDPLDLVHDGPVLPGTLQLGTDASDASFAYRPDRTELVLHGKDEGEVSFVADGSGGEHLEKRYRFKADGYSFELVASFPDGPNRSRVGLVLTPLPSDASSATQQVALALANRRLVEKQLKDVEKAPITVEDATWAGFAAQYFVAVAIPPHDGAVPAVFTTTNGFPLVRVDAPVVDRRAEFVVYAGPKDRDVLSRAGHDLERAIDFGMFWFVAIPLLRALHMLEGITGNYGIAIIVLTALVKVATAPLTQTTFRNMRKCRRSSRR